MPVNLSPLGGAASQFLDNNGVILSGGKLYSYAAGTTTPQTTYTSSSGVTPHANPIILDSAGRVPGGEIWLTDNLIYKFTVETSANILLGTYDNLPGINDINNITSAIIEYDPPFSGGVATTVQDKLSQFVSPIDFGAVGDGVTDDRAALETALESGFPVDGCGYTYAIDGSCTPSSIVAFQNANLLQIGDRSISNAQTLNLVGLSDFYLNDISINMGSGVTTLFSDDGNSGLYIGGTDYLNYVTNFRVDNVTVTGNGCGAGIQIRHAKRFFVDGCLVHDRVSGSLPDPTNDSQDGIELVNCANFTLSNSQCYNLKTRLSGVDTLKWARGFLFSEIRDCTIVGCVSTTVDQGFDFSGAYVAETNYIGNRRWVISSCMANSCGTYGFKFSNVARDGLVEGCIANNTATIAFVFSGSSVALPVGAEKYNTQNIDVVGCKVVNVLGNGWSGSTATGFRLMEQGTSPTYPRAIRLSDCHVADTQDTATTLIAYASDVTQVVAPTTGYTANIASTMTNCTADSTVATFNSTPTKIGPVICQVTGSSTQSVSNTTWTTLNWNQNTFDPNGLHNTATNSDNIFVKTAGWYRLTALVNFTSNATGSRQIRFLQNGNLVDRSTAIASGSATADTVLVSTILVFANSGDNFRVDSYQGSGGALNVKNNESYFSVEMI